MEKFIKKTFSPENEQERFIQQNDPEILYYMNTGQIGSTVYAFCLTDLRKEHKIEYSLFMRYYERAQEENCTIKSQLDRQLFAIFSIMNGNTFSWKNIKESILALKNKYPCYEAYIEMEYCKKQEELHKYEPLDEQ